MLSLTVEEIYSKTTLTSLSQLPPSPIDLDILHNLTQLIVVAQLTTIDSGEGAKRPRPFSYSNPLPWLIARLEMLTPESNLSEIVLRLNLSVSDTILRNIDWSDLARVLSSKNLPSLNLVTVKMSGQYTPLSPMQWAVLRENKYLSPLIDNGRLVLVNNSFT